MNVINQYKTQENCLDIVKSKDLLLKRDQLLFAHDRCLTVKTITTATTPTNTQMMMVMLIKEVNTFQNFRS